MLNTVVSGTATEKSPLLIVHGLFGSARNWGVIAKRLSATRQVLCVDMRNHGDSPWEDRQTYQGMADDLAEVIRTHGGPVDIVGHSMGGKAAMVLALRQPELLRRLVIADIAPVGYTHTQAHLIAAMQALDLSAVEKRSDADRQLAALVDDPGVRAFLLQSLDVKNRRWRLNLDVLNRDMADVIGFPEIDGSFAGPVFFLSGGLSDYVRPEYRAQIKSLFPAARFAKIPGVGHWLHAEKPREFEAAVQAFFDF